MYIEPNTTIKLYNNVPLDNTYEHTLYFPTPQAQVNYFHNTTGIVKRIFPKNTYQRVMKGKMRVEALADTIYDCNYLAFQNTNFGNKWFYGFITGIEYVNNVTSEITYEIDSLQTYMFDVTIKQSFVEREHSETDNVGDNLVKEDLDIGDYVFNPPSPSGLFDRWGVMVQVPYNLDWKEESETPSETPYIHFKHLYNNVYNANNIMVFKDAYAIRGTSERLLIKAEDRLGQFIRNGSLEEGKIESITMVSMFPLDFCLYKYSDDTAVTAENSYDYFNVSAVTGKTFTVNKPTTVGGYPAKNKKLLTYPYQYLAVRTNNNDVGEYRYEHFNSDACNFAVNCDMNTVTFLCTPIAYGRLASPTVANFNYSLTMGDLPMCSFNTDTYEIWWAQNKVSFTVNALMGATGGAITTASGVASANPVAIGGGALSIAHSIGNAIGTYSHMKSMPDFVKGSCGSGLGISRGFQDFMHYNVCIKQDYAMILDDYFTRYGYATKRVKVPNTSSRPHWNYTKTIGCVAEGHCPTDDLRKICDIYDNGITFWKHANEVGNYSLDNSPTV